MGEVTAPGVPSTIPLFPSMLAENNFIYTVNVLIFFSTPHALT